MSVDAIRAVRPRACPTCASTDDADVVAESNVDPARLSALSFSSRKTPEFMHHRYVRCPVCTLVYVTPAPVEDAVLDAYEEAAFDAGDESRLAARTYVRLLRRAVARVPGRGALVDVGAGDGAFLAAADPRLFTERVGFEPSAAPIAAADPEIRPLLRHEPFAPGALPDDSASIVTCLQTIEHLADPLGVCRAAARLLRPDGALLLVCHDAHALSARLLGERSPIFDVEHLQLFTRESIRVLLHRSGFANVEVSRLVNVYPLSYWMRLAPLPAKARLLRAAERSRVGRTMIALPAGNLAVFAQRG